MPWRKPHVFVPRMKGSKEACGYFNCGARRNDPIHDVHPKPKEKK
jgi:hypothetical protein